MVRVCRGVYMWWCVKEGEYRVCPNMNLYMKHEYIHVYTHTHTHTHIHIYMYTDTCIQHIYTCFYITQTQYVFPNNTPRVLSLLIMEVTWTVVQACWGTLLGCVASLGPGMGMVWGCV